MVADLPPEFEVGDLSHVDHQEILAVILADSGPGAKTEVFRLWAGKDSDRCKYAANLHVAAVGLDRSTLVAHAGQLMELSRRRKLHALFLEQAERLAVGNNGSAEVFSDVIGHGDAIVANAGGQKIVSLGDALTQAIVAGERARESGGLVGLSTGFAGLDRSIGGLEPGNLYVLGARPGMGKTALALQMAITGATAGRGVFFGSLEMNAAQLARRMLASEADVPLSVTRSGNWTNDQAHRLVTTQHRRADLPLHISERPGQTVDQIAAGARSRALSRDGLGLVVVDHLHLIRPPAEAIRAGATWAVGQVSNALKRMAKSLGVPVVALAQLNRGVESREDKRPGLHDLRQSGEIEQDADAVMLLHRPGYYLSKSGPERKVGQSRQKHEEEVAAWEEMRRDTEGKAELILAKVRDGEPGVVRLEFDAARTRFFEAEGWR